MDGDHRPDVLVGSDDAKVYAWHADGTALAGWPEATNLSVKGAPALANLDNEPAQEVIAADLSGTLYIWEGGVAQPLRNTFLPLVTRVR